VQARDAKEAHSKCSKCVSGERQYKMLIGNQKEILQMIRPRDSTCFGSCSEESKSSSTDEIRTNLGADHVVRRPNAAVRSAARRPAASATGRSAGPWARTHGSLWWKLDHD
jgi:hypothetical protein